MKKLSSFNIMLVEDEALLMRSLSRHIEQLNLGYHVVSQKENGLDALRAIETCDPHVIITDLLMPAMNGLELIKHVHAKYPHIQTVILSGYAEFGYAQEALKYNVSDYLLKPVEQDKLDDCLSKIKLCHTYELKEDLTSNYQHGEQLAEHICLYFREHYMDDIDLGILAQKYGISSAYLTKIFRKYHGDTPLKYLTDIRIFHAKHLLRNTELTIKEISERVGYTDQFHFSRVFHKVTGTSPSIFRK